MNPKIDNYRQLLPKATFLVLVILIVIGVWFIRGGSFRLYASLFFGLYFLTKTVWLSIILVSVAQNIAFLPLRFIGERFKPRLKEFEQELETAKEDDQYILFHQKVRQGDASVLIYILNFVLLTIAFISAGRVFLLDFYNEYLDPKYLYNYIPYPNYPLRGTLFSFPFIKITKTFALSWNSIFTFWGILVALIVIVRVLWLVLRPLFSKSKTLLNYRIRYNRLRFFINGFIGTAFVFSLYFLRHLPIGGEFVLFQANLARQNTAFNIVTAVCTFFATIYMGYRHNREAALTAQEANIPKDIIAKVLREKMRQTIRNAFLLSIFAYIITHQMPCSHDLSVLSFEFLYIISPLTFDRLIPKHQSTVPIVATNSAA